jgi:hypothetical protein
MPYEFGTDLSKASSLKSTAPMVHAYGVCCNVSKRLKTCRCHSVKLMCFYDGTSQQYTIGASSAGAFLTANRVPSSSGQVFDS